MKKGLFITFEGLDKVGKSTQVENLVKHLESKNLKVTLVREPGSTEISEKIRNILLDKENAGKISPLTELLLYNAARAQLVDDIIRPALERGEIVISDRFYDSTTAYQGYGRGLDIKLIHSVNMEATGNLVPDLTILMSVGPLNETINNHERFQSSSSDDRLERESLEFRERVRAGFLEIARQEADRFLVVDAEDTIENVAAKIAERVDQLLQTK
ncbi:MAG: dTMP kinase [Candidatus Zixiibacteriota bacterium]|nr:MAG: dTMP kinase [candidate division Zixibacteria bacterium]